MRAKKYILLLILLVSVWNTLNAQKPVADFSANITSGCAPLTVSFTNLSTNSPTLYQWDLGNGQLPITKNAVGSYSSPGTYTVRLVVQNASGTDDETKVGYITVFPSAAVNFKASSNVACNPALIQFTDLTTVPSGSIVSWNWDFGDGTTSNLKNPVHIYSRLGYFTVTLIVKTSSGCEVTSSRPRLIRIISGVTPNFDFTKTGSCSLPLNVNFINQTTGPGNISYKWLLGNGNTSTDKNPSTSYTAFGNYTIKLVATSSYGCSDSLIKPIKFSSNNTSFTAPDSVCQNKQISFINNGNPTPKSVSWDFGDGSFSNNLHPVKAYSTPGIYTVTMHNQYADCSDSYTRTIKVTSPPAIDFAATNTKGCKAPHTVNFTDLNPGSSNWFWDFGDGTSSTDKNPSHTYTSEGSYTVALRLTTSGGCDASVTKSAFVTISKPESIEFVGLPFEGCAPVTVKPTAIIDAIDGVAGYTWDFGVPGGIVTGPAPSFTYTNPGTYTVSLTITTNTGCIQTYALNKAVKAGTKPGIDFSTAPGTPCAGDSVHFTSSAAPADQWLWEFGDKDTSTLENPVHLYQDTGWMSVKLTVWNNGCKDVLVKPNLLRKLAPVALFEPVYDCANPLKVSFKNSSITDPTHGATTYSWNLGDGNPPTSIFEPTTVYPALGDYTVTLYAKDNTCDYTRTQTISLFTLSPDISINKPAFCRGEIFTLTATNLDPSKVAAYSWSIAGNPLSPGGSTKDSSLTINGAYDVTLTVTDIHGCTTSVTKPGLIKIIGANADFSVFNNGGCLNAQISITDQSSPAGSVTKWVFDFGDGTSGTFTTPPFTHSYSALGSYSIALTTTDNAGCVDTVSKTAVAAVSKPLVNFGATDTIYCPNTGLQFSDSTLGTGLNYAWDFGDGQLSASKDPVHSYAGAPSVYTVKLVVTDGFGCKDSLIRQNYIRIVSPESAFDVFDSASLCPPLETKFISKAINYDSLYWNFGDGNTSTLPVISNFYNNYGSFTAKLYARGHGGCLDSSEALIHVYNPASDLRFTYGPLEACNEITVSFQVIPPPGTKFKIFFGDGGIDSSGSATVQHHYNRPNYYAPSVQLADSLDCLVSVAGLKEVKVKGIYPFFDISKKNFCDTASVQLTDFSIGNDTIANRYFDFGDGTTSTSKTPLKYYGSPGTYLVSQNVTTVTGCTNSYTDTVRVYRTPVPYIQGPDDICVNNVIQLNGKTVVPDSLTIWKWSYGNGSNANSSYILNRYNQPGSDTVYVHTENALGCGNDTSKLITIWPLPVITNIPEIVVPLNTSAVLPITYSNNISSWTWQPVTGLSCADCPNPTASPQFTTNYKISVIDSNGCRANGSIIVRVICVDKNYFIPNTFSPNNDGQNDVFYPRGNAVDRIQSMRIFNRWGELVFDKKNFPVNAQSAGWNGLVRGMPAQSDTYVYIIEVICNNGQIVLIKGNVTLIR